MARKSRLLEIPQKWKDVEDEWYKLHPDVDPWIIGNPQALRMVRETQAAAAKNRKPSRKPARR